LSNGGSHSIKFVSISFYFTHFEISVENYVLNPNLPKLLMIL